MKFLCKIEDTRRGFLKSIFRKKHKTWRYSCLWDLMSMYVPSERVRTQKLIITCHYGSCKISYTRKKRLLGERYRDNRDIISALNQLYDMPFAKLN